MPLFSVIIPIFNTEKHLNKCIKSVIDQKHNKTEIVLIDDGSTDNSLKVCNSFKNNPLVTIVRHKKNLGVSITRNDGILAAKGKYILFLDSDDWLYSGCLRNLEKLIIKNPKAEVIIETAFLLIIKSCLKIATQAYLMQKIFFHILTN